MLFYFLIVFAHFHAVADDIAGAQVLVGGHLEEHGFQFGIVGLAFLVEQVLLDVGIEDGADAVPTTVAGVG